MFTFNSRLMACAALSAALLAGCGSNDDDDNLGAGAAPPEQVAQTITDVVAYINSLITDGGDSAEPLDTSLFTLVARDDAEPATLP